MSAPTPPPPALATRPATPADVPAMLALFELGYGAHNATSEVETAAGLSAAASAGRAVVALVGGQVVGYVARREIAPGLLGDGTFLVHPAARGVGVGTALLAAMRVLVEGRWAASLVISSTGYASVGPTKRSAVAVYTRAGYVVLATAGDTVVLWLAHPLPTTPE